MVVIVMGIAGAGKSTIGSALAASLDWRFVEGDDLHPPANVAKMRRGKPLNDADRAPWLESLRALIVDRLARGIDTVIACSALKQAYRDRLQVDPARVRLVFVRGEAELIRRRLKTRPDHFMPAELFESQRATLQPPDDAIEVDAAWPVAESLRVIRCALEAREHE